MTDPLKKLAALAKTASGSGIFPRYNADMIYSDHGDYVVVSKNPPKQLLARCQAILAAGKNGDDSEQEYLMDQLLDTWQITSFNKGSKGWEFWLDDREAYRMTIG
jgi:hypothetical protein